MAQQEIIKFEERIKLLVAIKKKIKMSTLEEFKEAYLKQE
jgi:hypothetical protein